MTKEKRERVTPIKVMFLGAFPPPMGGVGRQAEMLLSSEAFNKRFCIIPIKTNPIRYIEQPGKRWRWLSTWSFKLFIRTVSLAIRQKPDIVFLRANGDVSLIRNGIIAIVISSFLRVPLLIYVHITKNGSWERKSIFNKIGDRIMTNIIKKADALIQLSNPINEAFITRGWPCAEYIIPNAVDLTCLPKSEKKNPYHFCFIGRLSEAKGFLDILEALRKINIHDIDWTFHAMGIATSESTEKEIATILEEHPFRKNIVLHGLTTGEEKWNIMKKCSFMVFPTHKENFPNAILEALATGQAIISTEVGEIPAMIKTEGWLAVKIGDIEGIRNAIEILLSNHEKTEEMGRINRVSSKKYALATTSEQICSIIKSLVESNQEYCGH